MFGDYVDLDLSKNLKIDIDGTTLWVWASSNHNATISSTVYEHINSTKAIIDSWKGWKQIWNLNVIPRVKTFTWKLAHGKLNIGAFLYSLNSGPYVNCHFCGLEEESADHVIWKCSKVKHCWMTILTMLNHNPNDIQFLCSGNWLIYKDKNR